MTDNRDLSHPAVTGEEPLHFVARSMTGTLIERLGIEFVAASAEHLVATMPVAGNTQPYGLLHGGASVALAETLGSFGAMLHAGPAQVAVGIDVNATHHRAADTGRVTGTATALSLGRTLASYEVVVTDESGRRVCTARLTCVLRPARPRISTTPSTTASQG